MIAANSIRIGLISDTHMPERWAVLPTAVFSTLAHVDLLLHAGDVGELWVLDQLSAIAPVIAVHGNDDTAAAQRELPAQQIITIAGQRILLWHSHYPDRAEEMASRRVDQSLQQKLRRTVQQAQRAGASIAVFGHWHIPLVAVLDGVTVINPGAIASGNPFTRQLVQSVASLEIADRKSQVTHYNLAASERPYTPPTDIQATFPANALFYEDSLLAPDLDAMPHARLWDIIHLDAERLHAAVLRVAHRCWVGELSHFNRTHFLTEVQQDPTIADDIKAQVAQKLETLP
jgi:putative phosphoesterase